MRVDYAARAMTDLAQCYGAGLTRESDITARQRIPTAFLKQLLLTLRKAGLIRSVRGPTGGYQLARPASQITLAEVVEAIQGPVALSTCMQDDACTVFEACVLQDVWRDLATAHRRILAGITLDELVLRQAGRDSRDRYNI